MISRSIPVRLGIPLFAAALALPATAQDTIPTPAPVDVPALEPAALSLAGSECQGVARYLNEGMVCGGR